ncbi:UDPglucose 6-dehydrogenase [Allocatelliglobosispora scoriae]|uniref:UDPglucose 6-dehydrogenase n=1 Tax=Allocatelliglobosispora scoriae TaxID=643052 RepID=A0A841BNC6_9ACTN|nr:UDP binding domain-containing protein [Allocatelliglobosispora scoriae]MBB5868331.1 UDPglucose 6-dehydrogenase [Allocatelliglobosispora scoriae]
MAEVLVVGDWHLASVTAAGLLRLGYTVSSRPDDPDVADEVAAAELAGGSRAAGEPEITELLTAARDRGDLRLLSGAEEADLAAGRAELTVIAYDSRTAADGTAIDERPVRSATAALRAAGRTGPVIVMSQIRAGTGDAVLRAAGLPPDSPDLVHIPENLRLGRSLQDFLQPHRLVVGCNAEPPEAVRRLVDRLDSPNPLRMSLVEAELVKHGTNAYLAACITLANDLGTIAGHLGADPATVLNGVRADARVAPSAPMRPGEPYSGATLQRDVRALWEHGEPIGRDGLFRAISQSNAVHSLGPLAVLDRRLDGLAGRRVCLLGLTYKPGVSTLRDSPGLRLARELTAHGVEVDAFDPVADTTDLPGIRRHASLAAAADDTDCVVLIVEHEAFTTPSVFADLRPRNRMLLRLTGGEPHSRVPTPAGWLSIDPWRG